MKTFFYRNVITGTLTCKERLMMLQIGILSKTFLRNRVKKNNYYKLKENIFFNVSSPESESPLFIFEIHA